MRSLIWFRSDLRVHDNTALSLATSESESTFALFVISPGQWKQHDYAPVKVDFILRTLRALCNELATLNIPLLIRTAPTLKDVPASVLGLAKEHAIDAVFWNKEYEVDERARDEAAAALLAPTCRVTQCTDQTIFEPGDIRTGEGKFFTVFSPFKRAVYKAILAREGVRTAPSPKTQAASRAHSDPIPNHIPGFQSTIDPELWPAGERAARAALDMFHVEHARHYKLRRDLPSLPATSRLSPHLAVGSISPRECITRALAENNNSLDAGNEGLAHWISEVVWREFYIHILVGFPRVCKHRAFQPATDSITWNDNAAHLEAWKQGRTGVPIVDAGMRQLITTGWMHNRVRMITAMYLTKNLFIDWRLGEKWFMQNLVDGFLASNNGGWQWSASTGTDAAPYFRIFNPVSQSVKCDPEGTYIRRFVPELRDLEGETIHEPWTLPALLRRTIDYPPPLVDLSTSRQHAIDAFRNLRAPAE